MFDLVSTAKYWINRLRLKDWDLDVSWADRKSLPLNKSGHVNFVISKKIADIKILHPEDADDSWLRGYDPELTLVHELVHLQLAPWSLLVDAESGDEILLEQTVHDLSMSLIAEHRLKS